MKKLNKKALNVMATGAILASIVPMSAFAATDYRVDDVPNVSDDTDGNYTNLGALELTEDEDYTNDLKSGASFTVTYPSNVKLKSDVTKAVYLYDFDGKDASDRQYLNVKKVGDYTLNVTLPSNVDGNQESLVIDPEVKLDGVNAGPVKVTVDGLSSGVRSGEYTVANVIDGDNTVTTVLDTKTKGEEGGQFGTIRIEETSVGSTGSTEQYVELTLPNDFAWDKDEYVYDSAAKTVTNAEGLAGFSNVQFTKAPEFSSNGRKMTLYFEAGAASVKQKGILQITTFANIDDPSFGDIEVDVDGSEVDSATVKIGTYADFGVINEADSDVTTLVSGRLYNDDNDNVDKDDHELAEIRFKENVEGSFLPNRKQVVEFPSWVKIVDVEVSNADKVSASDIEKAILADIDGTDNKVEFKIPAHSGKAEFNLKFFVSVQADSTGDIVAKMSGNAGAEGEVLVGKAVAPISVETTPAEAKIGVQKQNGNDIVIKENIKAAIQEGKKFQIKLSDDAEWSGEPTIEVVEGDLEIDEDSIDVNDDVLTFEIDGESTKPSTIKISDVQYDLDRSVPEGGIEAEFGGEAIVLNSEEGIGFDGLNRIDDTQKGASDDIDAGEFDRDYVVKTDVINVVTPAPNTVSKTATFTLGSTAYTVDGVEKTADVAAYAENGRTFLPIRYVADALGVTPDNILYDKATSTVTLIKGDRVAQMTIGSNVLKINGASIAMDAKAQLKDNRTVLPLRYAAQALGASVDFDEATKTITVK